MQLDFSKSINKETVFKEVTEYLNNLNIKIAKKDNTRPWGGFFVIDESDSEHFIKIYFPHLTQKDLAIAGKLSPKILVVCPQKRLSWQYHHRRAEIWKLIGGTAAVVTSDTDVEKETKHLKNGDIIQLEQGERHRLVGLNDWGVIAEIWRHTDSSNPSDEEDIIRVQDDFGR
jgi:mannose-6-phosphate isomerase